MKKLLLIIGLMAMLLIAGCSDSKTTKKAVSGKAVATPKVVENTPVKKPAPVTPTTTTPDKSKMAKSATIASGTMEIIGSKGFKPTTMKIKKGASLTFVNKNPSAIDLNKNAVLNIQNKNTGLVSTSKDQIPYEGKYTHTFAEAGEYKVWDVGYGVMSTITVE